MNTTEGAKLGNAQQKALGRGQPGYQQVVGQLYNRQTANDKWALVAGPAASSASMAASANAIDIDITADSRATQTISTVRGANFIDGKASAQVTCNPFLTKPKCAASFAIAIVNDPIYFDPLPGPLTEPVTLSLERLALEASQPNDFAQLMYTFGTNDDLITFVLGIDYFSLTPTIDIVAFSSLLGYASESDFESFLRLRLNYSASTHTLTGGGFDLFSLSRIDQSTKLTFNMTAMAGVMPEPEIGALVALGLLLLAFQRRPGCRRGHLSA